MDTSTLTTLLIAAFPTIGVIVVGYMQFVGSKKAEAHREQTARSQSERDMEVGRKIDALSDRNARVAKARMSLERSSSKLEIANSGLLLAVTEAVRTGKVNGELKSSLDDYMEAKKEYDEALSVSHLEMEAAYNEVVAK